MSTYLCLRILSVFSDLISLKSFFWKNTKGCEKKRKKRREKKKKKKKKHYFEKLFSYLYLSILLNDFSKIGNSDSESFNLCRLISAFLLDIINYKKKNSLDTTTPNVTK
ncbi:hypothetical protein DDB_G0270676 [Dictyostelium discoideum AX4]|uniref:Uncharacterized protein n=1 Tax=Dictyostelium discoideum TaxID=44689 RepID=Q55CX2_DICDI|nr:hypothetical protein DDB_G0270676 [Dictyostelium discoideum AX4]EAL72688.1 hypothetical protein DDB_G0270676 [Dictyostelium discoideum AX4]|eukprot:XP_646359.1 hypothetical protein DDB_G0270676 [Dictyostelium discoideum AX4]